jgi:type IV pilus assembly protein PilM
LDELNWGYQVINHVAPKAAPDSDPGSLRSVVVAALRASDAKDQLQPFEQLGLAVQILQSESLALFNLLMFEQFEAATDADGQESLNCIALLDIGSDTTNLVVCSPDQVWFRALRWGGNDLNQALVREFKLTFAQAEEVKRHFDRARRLGSLLEVLDQSIQKLVAETQRSFDAFRKEQPHRNVDRCWLCGGGARQYGLLRQFQSGAVRSSE